MFGHTFYHGLHRKYLVLFGTLFNDITIRRTHGNPIVVDSLKIPLKYASQDKMMARTFEDADLNRKAAAISPAMSFEMMQPVYDAQRKLQTTNKMCYTDPTDGGTNFQYVGVPYNIGFKLYIYSREEEDGLKILEQILPYFTPALTVTANLIPEMGFNIDVPIVLENVDFFNDSYGNMNDRRKLIWTLSFKMKVQFLGPIMENRKVIRQMHLNFRDFIDEEILEEMHIQPGLTANGEPTDNSSLSIPIEDIDEDDNYGYVIEKLEGPEPHP